MMTSRFAGEHDVPDGSATSMENAGLIKSESMEVTNDPRFFTDNIINYRLAAFGSVSVISGLLVQNCMDHMFDMNKNMQLWTKHHSIFHPNGIFQLIAFTILLVILWANMLATYIGVAQPYHTIRLMTSGATGFEAAASYYLNKQVTLWRHVAIKSMLLSLPMFMFHMGFRLLVKFDRENKAEPDPPADTPTESRAQGIAFCTLLSILAFMLFSVHWKHVAVFRERYELMQTPPELTAYMQNLYTPRVSSMSARNPGAWGGADV